MSMPASIEFLPRRDSTPREALSLVSLAFSETLRFNISILLFILSQRRGNLYRFPFSFCFPLRLSPRKLNAARSIPFRILFRASQASELGLIWLGVFRPQTKTRPLC